MRYPAVFEPAEEGGFVITFPDVYEAITQGDDEREGLDMAQDALITDVYKRQPILHEQL